MLAAVEGGFTHSAVCHRATAELAEAVVPFIEEGLTRNERVFVNLAAGDVAALKGALGADADRVRWSDTHRWHPHPARRLRALQDLVDGEERHGLGHLRFVGGCPWPATPREMVTEWERFDAALNEALATAPLTMVCAYDVAVIPPDVVDRVASTHPLLGSAAPRPSPTFLGAEEYLVRSGPSSLKVPEGASRLGPSVVPGEARAFVREVLSHARPLPVTALDDLVVAVTEVVTNSWGVGSRSIEISVWSLGDEVGVQVDDDGPGLFDPLAGYRRPQVGSDGGRGLWIARQMTDLVEIIGTPGGTSVRLRMFAHAWQHRA